MKVFYFMSVILIGCDSGYSEEDPFGPRTNPSKVEQLEYERKSKAALNSLAEELIKFKSDSKLEILHVIKNIKFEISDDANETKIIGSLSDGFLRKLESCEETEIESWCELLVKNKAKYRYFLTFPENGISEDKMPRITVLRIDDAEGNSFEFKLKEPSDSNTYILLINHIKKFTAIP